MDDLSSPLGATTVRVANSPTATAVTLSRPNVDLVSQWQVRGAPTAWGAIDDPVSQPTSVDATDYVWAGAAGRVTEIGLTDVPLNGRIVQAATGWFFANTGSTTRLKAELLTGTTVRATTVVPAGSGFSWRSIPAGSLDQAALNDARLRFTVLDGGDSNVRATYLSVDADCQPGQNSYGAYGSFGAGNWPPVCWKPYSATSPFNRPLPANPRVHSNSAQIMSRIHGDISDRDTPNNLVVHNDGTAGEPTYYSRPTDPLFRITCTDFGGSCPIDTAHLPNGIRIPAGAVPEGGADPVKNPLDRDRHITVIDQQSGIEYDLWRVQTTAPLPATGGTIKIGHGGYSRIDGQGHGTTGTGTAAYFASLAGRIRAEEFAESRIEHALFIVINCDNGGFVFPARHSGRACSEIGRSNLWAPPMGTLLQLDMSSTDINLLRIPDWKRALLHAMARYGMYFGDTGSSGLFSIEQEAGNQYTSQGASDAWTQFAEASGWEPKAASPSYPYDHWLGSMRADADGGIWPTIWSKLRVIDPCVPQGTC